MNPISRRHFLRGAGVAVSLPFLDAMVPSILGKATAAKKAAAAAAAKPPVRLGWIYFPNGVIRDDWTLDGLGTGFDFKFNKTNAPLEKVRDHVLMFSNISHDKANKNGDGPGDHSRCSATFLTASQARKTQGKDIYLGISADQVAAQHIAQGTRLPSLELTLEKGKQEGRCDSGYSCVYLSNISWRSPTQPASPEINPRRAFDRLFGMTGADAEKFKARALDRQSVLDFVADDARSLRKKLGTTDKRKLDEYFESVRETELYINRVANMPPAKVSANQRPPENPDNIVHHSRLMYDLMVLAYQTDSTRVISNMLADGQTNRIYENLGISSGHHQLTHSRGKAEEIQRIDQFLVEEFARFIKKLADTPDGQGRLIDNCLIAYGSGIGDGRRHDHDFLPTVLAGHGGGAVDPGRHVVAEERTPMANIYVSMLQAAGAPVDAFGDSTGPMAGLKV